MAEDANKTGTFSDFEKQAMRDRAKELKAQERAGKNRALGEKSIFEAIDAMTSEEKALAKRIHEIVKETAPELFPKTWYGMPAYANSEGKVVCFFQAGKKFESRYCSLGFNDNAKLDDGNMWPTAFAIVQLTNAEEDRIKKLVKKSVA